MMTKSAPVDPACTPAQPGLEKTGREEDRPEIERRLDDDPTGRLARGVADRMEPPVRK